MSAPYSIGQRHAVFVRDAGDGLDIADISRGIPDCLAKHRSRLLVYQPVDVVGMVRFGETHAHTLGGQNVGEKRMRRAVKLGNRDDIRTWLRDIYRGIVRCRLPCADTQGIESALESGDPTLQHSRGRIADAAVTISLDFEIEQRCPVIGGVERIRDSLIDRNRQGFRRWIRLVAEMDSDRFRFHGLK